MHWARGNLGEKTCFFPLSEIYCEDTGNVCIALLMKLLLQRNSYELDQSHRHILPTY